MKKNMDITDDKIYELIAKQLRDKLSTSEKTTLNQWIELNESNKLTYESILRSEKPIELLLQPVIPNKEEVWTSILAGINKKHQKLYKRAFLIKVTSAAAMVAIVLGFSFSYIIKGNLDQRIKQSITSIIAPAGQKTEVLMPDGSKIWLNSGSKLSYSGSFNDTQRQVTLEGEAYFKVQHDTKRRFIVSIAGVDVAVLGTAFNVKSYADNKNVEVTLLQGKVALEQSSNHKLISQLLPNQQGIVDKSKLTCQVSSCNASESIMWSEGQLIIDNKNLLEISKMMNVWYGVNIQLLNYNPHERFTFKIKTESLTETFKLLNRLTPIQYTIDGKEVTVRVR
jgi:transmembrane sensor